MSSIKALTNTAVPAAGSGQAATADKEVKQAESFKAALEKATAAKDDAALRKVCEDFESIFVNMMFKSMRQAGEANEDEGIIEKSFGRGIFEEMRDEELAKKVAEGGGIGIADVMYRQLKKYTEQTEQTASATLDVKG